MLVIHLSTLSRPELKRLLKVALERGDGPLTERLEWELGSRGKGGGRRAPPVAVAPPPQDDPDEENPREDLDEPADDVMDWDVEPDAEPFAQEPIARQPFAREPFAQEPFAQEPIALEPFALEPFAREPFAREPIAREPIAREPIALEPTAPQPASARGGLLLVGLVAGCLISGGVFWGLGQMDRSPAAGSTQAPAPQAMAARPLEAAPAPRPEPTVAAPEVAPVVAAAKPPVEVATKAAPPKEVIARKERAPRPPPPAVRLAEAEATTRTPVQSGACARSTPADRLVCGDLSLQLFDLQLQDAYRRALNARVDPVIVGEAQAAWRRARDEVSDPQRLARLYNQRIHELDAATAAAQENRPPG